MKITTWNVNGLRALLRKNSWEWVRGEKPDVICLQEIKARPDQLSPEQHAALSEHEFVWNPAERPGYSGVANGFLEKHLDTTLGFGVEKFDIEGRVIQSLHPGFSLFNIYFPNGGRGHERLAYKLEFYELMLQKCLEMVSNGEEIVLCGDFNTAHNEIDLANPRSNRKTSGFMDIERAWVDRYLEAGFVDIYRKLYPERVQYTWWTYITNARARNVGWRLDYFLITPGLVERVVDTVIHNEAMGSDHCPVSLIID
jgi:exodeoxyribonuclease-3